jgi:simple sugar transport system substrate-binding protein
VIYQEIDDATNADASAGVPDLHWYHIRQPGYQAGRITDHGNLTGTMQTFFESAGLGPDDAYAAGFDMSGNYGRSHPLRLLDLVIDQQQWLQGYFGSSADLPDPQLRLSLVCIVDTGAGFGDKDNVETLAGHWLRQQIR